MGSKSTVFRTQWFSVEKESFKNPASVRGEPYYRINSGNNVLIFAVTEDKKVILIRQFRPALRSYTLEFPSGGIEKGESPLAAAKRELYEETGYQCASMRNLGTGRIMMNRNSSVENLFLGLDAKKTIKFKPSNGIKVLLEPMDRFKQLVRSGEFQQIAALGLLTLAHWKRGYSLS